MFVSKIHNPVAIPLAILLVTLFSTMPIGSLSVAYASPVTADKLIELTNQARADNGLNTLLINSLLIESAQGKSNDMLAKNYFAHTSPEGVTPWDWFVGVGYDYIYAGENLAKNYATAEAMFNAWMNSPTHRANILSENYREIGIAIATDGSVIYATQHFGTQKPGKTAGTTVTQVTPTAPVRQVAVAPPADTTAPVIADAPLFDAVIKQGESVSFALTVTGNPEKVVARVGKKSVALIEQDGKWVGKITLYAGGNYSVFVDATDAAGNTATRTLGTVLVTVPDFARHTPNMNTLVAAYWKDVAVNEGLPIVLTLAIMAAVGLGFGITHAGITPIRRRLAALLAPALAR